MAPASHVRDAARLSIGTLNGDCPGGQWVHDEHLWLGTRKSDSDSRHSHMVLLLTAEVVKEHSRLGEQVRLVQSVEN